MPKDERLPVLGMVEQRGSRLPWVLLGAVLGALVDMVSQ
jgi:hypothetical protein